MKLGLNAEALVAMKNKREIRWLRRPAGAPIARLSLELGETIEAMTLWPNRGMNYIVVATSHKQLWVVRIDLEGQISTSGPLKFVEETQK